MAERSVPRHARTIHADDHGLFVKLRSVRYRPTLERPSNYDVGDRVIAVLRKTDPTRARVGIEEWVDEEADGE